MTDILSTDVLVVEDDDDLRGVLAEWDAMPAWPAMGRASCRRSFQACVNAMAGR